MTKGNMTSRAGALRVAVVGCGGISRQLHLPVLSGHEGVKLVALVDCNLQQTWHCVRHFYICPDYGPSTYFATGRANALLEAIGCQMQKKFNIIFETQRNNTLAAKACFWFRGGCKFIGKFLDQTNDKLVWETALGMAQSNGRRLNTDFADSHIPPKHGLNVWWKRVERGESSLGIKRRTMNFNYYSFRHL